MENNFNQEKLKKRVLEKLQNKIASEEFKNKENIEKGEKRKSKNNGFKVAVIFMVGMLVGNGYTYATYNENLFSFILSRVGIISEYNEKSTVVEQDGVAINNNSLILSSYAMDEENLVITYKLKLAEKVERFEDYFQENPRIVDSGKTYTISEKSRISFYKISDTEYEIVKIYDVKNLEISNDARFVTTVTLYKELLDDVIQEELGVWKFDVNIIKNNSEESKVYTLENKVIDIYNKDGSRAQIGGLEQFNIEPENVIVKIEELRLNELGTKIIYSGFCFSTDPGIKSFVEIVDENGNVLLGNNTEELVVDSIGEILFAKVNLNSKITINIDIVDNFNSVIAEGSITLDLSKDLVEKKNVQEELNNMEVKWNEIAFSINDNMEISEMSDGTGKDKIIHNNIYKNEYGFKNYECSIEITRSEEDLSLDQYSALRYIISLANGEGLSENDILVYYYNNYIELTYEEIVEIAKVGKIVKDGKEITIDSLKKNSMLDISQITNKEYYDKEVYEYEVETGDTRVEIYILEINNYKYEFKIPTKLNVSNEIEKFVSSIKII